MILFHSLNVFIDISLGWGAVCPFLDKMNTLFFHISFYGDYLFVYASDNNYFVVLLQITPENADIP